MSYNTFKSKKFWGRKYSFLSFFRSSAARKSFLLELLIKSGETVEFPGSTVILEGITDVNKALLHSYSEIMKYLRFPVGKMAVTWRRVSGSEIRHCGPVMSKGDVSVMTSADIRGHVLGLCWIRRGAGPSFKKPDHWTSLEVQWISSQCRGWRFDLWLGN